MSAPSLEVHPEMDMGRDFCVLQKTLVWSC